MVEGKQERDEDEEGKGGLSGGYHFGGRPTSKFPKNTHVPLLLLSFQGRNIFHQGGEFRADRNLKSVWGGKRVH